MELEQIREIIIDVANGYGVSNQWTFQDIMEQCLDRLDLEDLTPNQDLQELAYSLVDDEMIYTDDQWELMRAWNDDPREANLDEALCDLSMAVYEVLTRLYDIVRDEKVEEIQYQIEGITNSIKDLHNQVMQLQDDLTSISYDEFFDEANIDNFDGLENDLDDIEAFLSEYDVIHSCEEETNEVDDDILDDIDLVIDEEDDND